MKFFKIVFFLFWLINVSAQNTSLKNYTTKDGLQSLDIKNITQDSIGYLWLATDKGITRFDGSDFTSFSTKDGLISNKTNCIVLNNNNLLVGTDKGLSIKINNKFQNFEGRNINSIFIHRNNVFLATSEGIYILEEDYLAPLKINLQIDFTIIKGIVFYNNHYWIATNKALWKVDNMQNPKSIVKTQKGDFSSLLIENNRLIATTNNSLKIVQGDKVETINSSLKEINSISTIDKKYWISSTYSGIEILNSDFSFNRKINKYNTLTTDKINFVFKDRQHNTWIATQDNGVYFLPTIIKKTQKPTIHFENIEVAYQSIDSIFKEYSNSGVLKLSSSKNNISFNYKTVNISQPKSILYQYRINDETSPWIHKNSVNFANLASGNYTFTVQSKLKNIKSTPIQFSFYIDKPLHQKPWFYWVVAASLFLIFGSVTLIYIKNLKSKNKTKLEKLKLENHLQSLEQKALQLQMNPHFVFNVLNGIKALGNNGKSKELNETINKFAILLRSVLNSSRQEEISLAEEISTLKIYIELEQQMTSTPFEHSIVTDIQIDLEEILIPPMLLQPFVENGIKHGINTVENGKIDIKFSIKDDFLLCSITDNGIGYYHSKKIKSTNSNHQSIAVKVTKERIENLSTNSKFSITELKEKNTVIGTKVWFKIPLKTDF